MLNMKFHKQKSSFSSHTTHKWTREQKKAYDMQEDIYFG